MTELVIVATERQVELVSREGSRAETRRRLFERLAAVFLADVRFAGDVTCHAALSTVLLHTLEGDPSFKGSRASFEQVLGVVADALSELRVLGVDARTLGGVEAHNSSSPLSAHVLRKAMNALDMRLNQAGLVDVRLRGWRLAEALERAKPDEVVRALWGARPHTPTVVRTRFIVRWVEDATWWRALTLALRRASGDVVVELPVVVKPIDASRTADPFESVVGDVARALDDAPVEAPLESVFGDLTFTSAVSDMARSCVAIRRCLDAEAEARAAVLAVTEALEAGAPIDRIAVAVPRGFSVTAQAAIERHFDEAGIALHFGGPEPTRGALETLVFALLTVGTRGLPRHDVAAVLRSTYIDARITTEISDGPRARVALDDLAAVLEQTPGGNEDAGDPVERLATTARGDSAALARHVGDMLMTVARTKTRGTRVRAVRALLARIGLGARPSRAVRAALARDAPASPLVQCEIDAYARDARVIEALTVALDDLERVDVALGEEPCSAESFCHELERALWVRGAASAARAGAVRAVRVPELAGEPLDLVVIVDANAGVLPARDKVSAISSVIDQTVKHAGARKETSQASELVELALAMERTRRIVLCHRVVDDDGAALAPSALVSWLERGGVPSVTVHGAPLMGPPTTPHERTLALLAVAPERASHLAPYAARVAVCERHREELHASTTKTSMLDGASELLSLLEIETGGGVSPLAVTAVERIARCKFQGFAAQVLKALDDDPRRDDVPDRREEGMLTHEALSAAFTAAAPQFQVRPRDRDAIERAAQTAADAVLARDGGAVVQAALDRIRVEVANIVSLAIDDDAWNFALAEQGFGNVNDAWPPLVIEDSQTRVALRGRIDRLDLHAAANASAVRAIDYKRRVSLPPTTELGSAAIQVPIYALVAQRELGTVEAQGRYLSTVRPARSSTPSFDARMTELVRRAPDGSTEATRFVLETVRGLRAGDLTPRPIASKWCAQCGLDGACRRPRFAVTLAREEDE